MSQAEVQCQNDFWAASCVSQNITGSVLRQLSFQQAQLIKCDHQTDILDAHGWNTEEQKVLSIEMISLKVSQV